MTLKEDIASLSLVQRAKQLSEIPGLKPADLSEAVAETVSEREQIKTQDFAKEKEKGLLDRQLALEERELDVDKKLSQEQITLEKNERLFRDKLEKLNRQTSNQLFNEQMQFQRDELGRTQWNETKLIDWAITKSKSDEELMKYEQIVTQAYERKRQIRETAFQIVYKDTEQKFSMKLQELEGAWKIAQNRLDLLHREALEANRLDEAAKLDKAKRDFEFKLNEERRSMQEYLTRMKRENELQAQRDASAESGRQSIWTAGGTILGAIAGSFIPIPGATAVGAAIGGAVGSTVRPVYNSQRSK